MTYIMTYSSLTTTLESYLDRLDTSLISEIPTFIALAENRIARESKVLGLRRTVVSAFVAGVNVVDKPQRWHSTAYFNFGTGATSTTRKWLKKRPYDFCRYYAPDGTATAEPLYYADYDYNHFLIAPTPDAAYPFELSYFEKVDPLDSVNTSNWLTLNAPDLLLYACLLETAPYLKDDERVAVWQASYDRALASLSAEDQQQTRDLRINKAEGIRA
jgi:hypothetical protein